MANWDSSQISALYSALESHAKNLGVFLRVNTHDAENPPSTGLSCSIILGPVAAYPAGSGLSAVSVTITFLVMIFNPLMQKPLDGIDPDILTAVSTLLGEYSSNFTLGGLVRNIDLLNLRSEPAYVNQDGTEYRVEQVSLPIVIDDAWTVSP
jgi:hypothetical protein